MITIICPTNNQAKFKTYALKTILLAEQYARTHNLPLPQLITPLEPTIALAFNKGIKEAIYPIKVFIHEDVDMIDDSWIPKLNQVLTGDVGLVGLIGTTVETKKGFWWESGYEHIQGELWSGLEKADWKYKPVNISTEVQVIDGFFMATNTNITFDDSISLGYMSMYDLSYCKRIRNAGYKIKVMDHKAWHIGEIREPNPQLLSKYYS